MKRELVAEIIDVLGEQRRIIHYFKDRYCFDLIEWELQRLGRGRVPLAELRNTRVGRYLNKPEISLALAALGGGVLEQGVVSLLGPVTRIPLVVSLGCWGDGLRGWDQTSRNQSNLVLQLNFDSGHDAFYRKTINPDHSSEPFAFSFHPIAPSPRNTLAWVRLDIDFDTDEVLIEEIQNDWLREASETLRCAERRCRDQSQTQGLDFLGMDCSLQQLREYVETVLKPYQAVWAEAALLVALQFVRNELGISSVYYHSFDTGRCLKRVEGQPPRSLYTKLPRDFGFKLTEECPRLLSSHPFSRRCLKTIASPCWYHMTL